MIECEKPPRPRGGFFVSQGHAAPRLFKAPIG
jgi:hypothetical protein